MPSLSAPRLSLCIATFNRAALLREALEAVAGQGDAALFAEVEVCVSDNASADGTENMVREFAASHPHLNLRYLRHPENIGADRNMLGLAMEARGEFVWILSDDDLLLPGAVRTLLSEIAAHPELDAFCLNMRAFQKDPAEKTPPVFALKQDTRLPDRDACLRLFGTWMTFMSLLVFRRSALRREGYAEFLGTYLVLGYLYLDVLDRGAQVLSVPLLCVRDNFGGGFNFFEVFVVRFHQFLAYARQQGYSPAVTAFVSRRHLRKFLFHSVVTFKRRDRQGRPSVNYRDGIQRLREAYPDDPFAKFVMLPLLHTPSLAVQVAYTLYRLVKRPVTRSL